MGLALDEPNADEVTTPVNGIEVLISHDVKELAGRSTVDYISGPYGEGFTVAPAGFAGC